MRMRIDIIRYTMRCPTCVPHAEGSLYVFSPAKFFEPAHLACLLIDFQISVCQRNACAVISAIFQTMKPFNQQGESLLVPNVTNYSAHMKNSFEFGVRSLELNQAKLRNGGID